MVTPIGAGWVVQGGDGMDGLVIDGEGHGHGVASLDTVPVLTLELWYKPVFSSQ
jgi:hypothetical protein